MINLATPYNTSGCKLLWLNLLALLFFFLAVVPPVQSTVSGLSPSELAWLEKHDQLRVQLAEDWPPFNYTENNIPKGYVNDYIVLLADKLGLKVNFVRGFTWTEYVEMLKQGTIDCITNMTITPERSKHFLFSRNHVVDIFNGILTLKENAEDAGLEKLRGETLAVVRGYAQEELLKLHYPDINLLPTENLLDSIRRVMAGEAHAAIGAHSVFNYYITRHFLDEVKSTPVSGNIIFPSAPHYLAVTKENQVLMGLLDKAASSLAKAEQEELKKKWSMLPQDGNLHLSAREQLYLNRKKQLNMCVDPDWMPIESIRNGEHIGMAADYMQLLGTKLGVEMELVATESWKQTIDFARERRCDLISLAMSTPGRRLFLHFSIPYFTSPLVVAVDQSASYIADLSSLRDRRVGVKTNYAFGKILRAKFPEVNIVDIPTLEQGLEMVRDGSLDGFIDSLPALVYSIQRSFSSDLKIAGNTGEELELRMGLRNDEPLLLSVMNKAIDSITTLERQEILNRWVAVSYEEAPDYTLAFQVLAVAVMLVVILLYRQLTLNKFNQQLQKSNKEILHKQQLLQNTQQQLLLTQYAVDSCSFPILRLYLEPDTGEIRVVHANRAAVSSLGYTTPEEFSGIEPAAIAEDFEELIAKGPEKNGKTSPESSSMVMFHRKDGSTFPVDLHISSFVYDEKEYRFIFFRDITTQREMEAKLHRSLKMEAMGLMAGGVAHDLNNILSGIVSYPELILLQLEENDPLRDKLLAIKKSGEQAAEVVNDLLTVTRGIAAERHTMNLNALVMIFFESPEFKQLQERFPKIRCSLQLDHDLKNLNCSPLHIKKSIMNLVINAYEATLEEGTVTITTRNLYIEKEAPGKHNLSPGDYVVLEIQDKGMGIPESAIPHIFEPFYSKKQMGKSGTGLGLAIVANCAYDHGGSVGVDNIDDGARFRLILPATDEEVDKEEDKSTIEAGLYGNNERILVIDDEPRQLEIAGLILNELGYRAQLVSSGEEGIELMGHERFELVVLDMIMPRGLSGKETFSIIKEKHPEQRAVLVSGFAEDSDVRATLSMGAGGFVRKPYTLNQIALAIKKAL